MSAGWALAAWAGAALVLAILHHVRDAAERTRRRGHVESPRRGPGGEARDSSRWDRQGRRVAATLLLTAGLAASAAGWGRAAAGGALAGLPLPLASALALLLGFGVLSYALFLLGLAGLLRRGAMLTVAAPGLLLFAADRGSHGGLAGPPGTLWQPWTAVAAVCCAAALGILALACFGPSRGFDTLAYHLELPRRYAQSGRLDYVPFMAHSAWPQAGHMLMVPGFLFRCPHLAQAISYLMGAALLSVALGTALWSGGTGAALAAAVLLLGSGDLIFQMTEASVDAALGAFTAASIACFAFWSGSGQTGLLVLSGVFAGLAAAVKISALLLPGLLSVLSLAIGPAGRDVPGALLGAAALSLCAGCVALPWYARSAWLTGNPVYHFMTGVFRTRNWAPSSEAAHRAVALADGWGPVRGPRGWLGYALELLTRSPSRWGAGIVALGPAALLQPPEGAVRTAGVAALVVILATLAMTSQIRLMLGPAALLCAAAGVSAAELASALPSGVSLALFGAAGLLAVVNAADASRHKLRAALDPRRVPEVLRRFLPYYDDFLWINRHTPPGARLLLWTTRGYLLERDYVWLPPWQQGIFDFSQIREPDQWWAELKRLGVTHVYFTDYEIKRPLFDYLYRLQEGMVRQGRLLEERVFPSGYTLYRVA
ncbi:MAG TPA: hypothetical protein VJV23_06650 [Candidatus Polarisedimenticolia bacterium]|nr:hypothetical protein [Candidatus Polarisedimenticolia bacterium]